MKAKNKGILLRKIMPGDEVFFIGDIERTYQMVQNLIDNAIKYTPENGRIWVRIKEKEKDISIEVIDTGIGIPEDKQDKVFERFYQVDSSISRAYGGTGLGLAICKEIVRSAKGTIKITSPVPEEIFKKLKFDSGEKAVGTMFEVSIPKKG
jgi:signal transduction histidine kinase